MSGLLIRPVQAEQRQSELAMTPARPEDFDPPWWSDPAQVVKTAYSSGGGIMALAADTWNLSATGVLQNLYDLAAGTQHVAAGKQAMRQTSQDWFDQGRLDPVETGAVGRLFHTVGQMAVPIGAGLVNPLVGVGLAAGTVWESSFDQLQHEGVDLATAHEVASLEAALTGVAAFLPFSLGARRWLSTLLIGPSANIATGFVGGQASGAMLDAHGYPELANQYRTMDAESFVAQAIIGAGFGYMGSHHAAGRIAQRTALKDAALAAWLKQQEFRSGPGTPVDGATQAKHIEAFRDALDHLSQDKPVNAAGIAGAVFLRDPELAVAKILRQSGYPEIAKAIEDLQVELEQRGITTPDEVPLPKLPDTGYAQDLPPREPGEIDTAYAKRVIDHLPLPETSQLPDQPDLYFDTAGAQMVPIDELLSTKSTAENATSSPNALRRFAATAAGALSRRVPLSVVRNVDGTFHVVDGNASLTAAQAAGWKSLPVIVKGEQSIPETIRHYGLAPETQTDLIRHYEDAQRNGQNIPGRTDMMAGKGELFAGAPPEQMRLLETAQAIADELPKDSIATPDGDRPAEALMAEAGRDVQKAEHDSKQFDAAVSCWMRHGT